MSSYKFFIAQLFSCQVNLDHDKVYLIVRQDGPFSSSKLTSAPAFPGPQPAAMNNEQFRRLLADTSSTSKSGGKSSSSPRNAAAGGATPGAMLGSRMRSSIPMTPYVSNIPRSQSTQY